MAWGKQGPHITESSESENSGRRRKRRKREAARRFDGEEGMDRIENMEEKRRKVELERIKLEEKRFEREFEGRERGREEGKERAELDKAERLAMIKLLGSMADSFKNK